MPNLISLKSRLQKNNYTIATAESITAGNIQAMLATVSGISSVFAWWVTAYNLDQKHNLLGVDYDHAKSCNCVSPRVAQEMAVGACKLFGTSIGISSTGYAGPYPEAGIDHAFAYVCVYNAHTNTFLIQEKYQSHWEMTRIQMQQIVAEFVLEKLCTMIAA
jgi:PncC family amidohydrolase